jgi:hypothetical protein
MVRTPLFAAVFMKTPCNAAASFLDAHQSK